MTVVLVGANPGLLLRADGAVTAFASLWQVDYSARETGRALVLWHDDRVRLLGSDTGCPAGSRTRSCGISRR